MAHSKLTDTDKYEKLAGNMYALRRDSLRHCRQNGTFYGDDKLLQALD
jgi:hypothetical protein